jgi:hypothetical protein
MEIDVFMINVDQGNEIIEHIIFKKRLHVIEHVVHIPFTNIHSYYEIIDKNIPSLCNVDIIAFEPNKVSTSINEDKLDLVEGIGGASNAIFMIRV